MSLQIYLKIEKTIYIRLRGPFWRYRGIFIFYLLSLSMPVVVVVVIVVVIVIVIVIVVEEEILVGGVGEGVGNR